MKSLPLQYVCNTADFTNLIASLINLASICIHLFTPTDIKTENILEPYIGPLSPVLISITKADFYLNF